MTNLHEKFVQLGNQRRKLMNELLAMLPDIYNSGIYKKYATDIFEYAGRYGGLSRSSVEKRLRIERHIKDKPLLKEAIKEVGLHKVSMVATLVTKENEEMLVDKLTNMSKEAISELSKEMRNTEKPKMTLEQEVQALFDKAKQINLDQLKELLTNFIEKSVTGDETSRHIPNKKSLSKQCSYPNCQKLAQVIHHPHRYSKTKTHKELMPLCKAHHEFAHNGIIQNEILPPELWRIYLHKPTQKADLLYRHYRKRE